MAKITLNPAVDDYVVEIDWGPSPGLAAETRELVLSSFEDGKLIVFRNHPLKVDYALLNSFELPDDEGLRKLSYRRLLYPWPWRTESRRAILGAFGGNLAQYLRVRAEIQRVNEGLSALCDEIFPGYRVLKKQYSWRFLPTDLGVHPVHLDSYGGHGELHYVRLFLNLDVAPRVWRVADRLDTIVRRDHAELDWDALSGLSDDRFCFEINRHVARQGAEIPTHEAAFEQGDLWLCDTRKIPHGVVAGHRMVATHFWVDPASMADPSKAIDPTVAAYIAEYGAVATAAE